MPLAYFVGAAVLAMAILPSALRPPQQPPTQTAELSPDAPPDDEQQAIVAAFSRGVSATAGLGTGTAAEPEAVAVAPAKLAPRACPRGFGNPPRQTESLYSPPCAPAFVGNNGGATHKGVTANEIRIAVTGTGAGNNPNGAEGPIADEPTADENAARRTFRVLQMYFNRNYQLYGRRIQFINLPTGSSISDQQTAAVKADQEFKVFAGNSYGFGCDEFARRKMVCYTGHLSGNYYAKNHPFVWSYSMEGSELARFGVEYICKKLAGKPAQWAGDPAIAALPRKFGQVIYNTRGYEEVGAEFDRLAMETCGVDMVTIGTNLDNSDGQAELALAATKLQQEGVTTMIPNIDWVSSVVLTNQMANQGYFPEVFTVGGGAMDRNQLAQLQNQAVWRSTFGITALEMERPEEHTDCFRAYRSIDPTNAPHYVTCTYLWPSLQGLIAGIQMAGPKLTPENFAAGLHRYGMRFYDRPVWAMGGGFGPGIWTYPHNVTEIWYDVTARDPQNNEAVGAYRYLSGGKRYRLGELPAADLGLFETGDTMTEDSTSTEHYERVEESSG